MIIFNNLNLSHDGVALIESTLNRSIRFQELRQIIKDKSSQFAKSTTSIHFLEAENSIQFVTDLLALFHAGRPVSLLSKQATSLEKEKRKNFILQHSSKLHSKTRLLMLTSGSTQDPKVVQLSAENIDAALKNISSSLHFNETKEQTLFLPLHYSFGLLGQLLPALCCGVTTRFIDNLTWLRDLEERSLLQGMLSGIPAQLQFIAQSLKPNSKVTHVISAGDFLNPTLRKQLVELFPKARISSNYGLTEAAPRILSIDQHQPDFYSASAGFPIGDWKLKIVEEELWAKGHQVMLGYLGDDLSTQDKIHEGWLRTGDLAHMDSKGLVTLKGRLDLSTKIKGERIHLQEIESTLSQWDWVQEVVAMSVPGPTGENHLACAIVPKTPPPDPQQVVSQINLHFSLAKRPSQILIAESLPRTQNNKINRLEAYKHLNNWKRFL